MIKNVTALLLFFATTLLAQTNFSPFHTKVSALTAEGLVVEGRKGLAVGASGVVIHTFENNHQTIISSVEVIKKEGNKLLLKQRPFPYTKQHILPNYKIAPKVGDEVILNFLYNRAVAIVPDASTYKTVTKSYEEFEWVHPDIFAAKLSTEYNPTPNKKTFQKMCINQNIGLLLIYANETGHFVDCTSFKTIYTIPLPTASETKAPFYNRLEPIKGRLFGLFGGKGVHNYDRFYSDLLK